MKILKFPAVIVAALFGFLTLFAGEEWTGVVKIFAVSSPPNYFLPWQNFSQQSGSGTGFVIDGNRIITNAHVVAYPTFITVRKPGDQTRYPAKVVAVNHECDLAILTVEDSKFFDGIKPLELADLPPMQSSVAAVGYPVGGDNVSITVGVLSRVEPLEYSHSGKELLGAQIDAAINPGNSGGPVLHEGKVVGIAFQGLGESQNIGYMIPCSVLKHFLEDLKSGKVDGFPDVPFDYEKLENPDLREYCRMKPGQSGILVTSVPEILAEQVPLKAGDVVMKVENFNIANDATIDQGQGKVLYFGCVFWEKQLNTPCRLTILRDGKEMTVETKTVKIPYRIPNQVYDREPEYYIAGGLVFTPLTANFIYSAWRNPGNMPADLAINLGKPRSRPDEEIVIVSMVLADEVNLGYQNIRAIRVVSVNGEKIVSLRQLADLIDRQKDGFLTLVLQNDNKIVMNAAEVKEATPRVMFRYRIASDRSTNLTKPLVFKK